MDHRGRLGAIAAAVCLASCGRPDASGVYLATSGREVALFQLAQDKDGAVSGRVEVISIGPGGTVDDQSGALEGAAAGHDLVFKPAPAGSGGVGAAGSFDGGALTVSRNGTEVKARKASLDAFQKAASQLKLRAAAERKRIADAQAGPAGPAAEASAFEEAAGRAAKLQQAASALRADAARLEDAVSAAPDYGRQSADNTARIAKMAQTAPALPKADRGRLLVEANQVIVGTNQIDVARTRYAIGLDQIVQRAAPLATAVQRFCDSAEGGQVGPPCAQAKAAAIDFQSALVHGSSVFRAYKQAVQAELSRQNALVRGMGG